MAIVTYRSKFDPRPAPLPAILRPISTDIGDPSRFRAPFDASGLLWAIVGDDAGRSWQVPLFRSDGSALWHWSQIRKRNLAGYAEGIGPYLDAERSQMAALGLTYQPDLWLGQGYTESRGPVQGDGLVYGGQGPIIRRSNGMWGVYRRSNTIDDWGAIPAVLNPGTIDTATPDQVHNDTVTLILKGSKVWARCNPWIRVAMPYGMPGEVSSDGGAWQAIQTLKGALEFAIGYLTDNVMLMAHGIYDVIETWYDYATAGARERAADSAFDKLLIGDAHASGLRRGAPASSSGGVQARRQLRAPVITWSPRKKRRG